MSFTVRLDHRSDVDKKTFDVFHVSTNNTFTVELRDNKKRSSAASSELLVSNQHSIGQVHAKQNLRGVAVPTDSAASNPRGARCAATA